MVLDLASKGLNQKEISAKLKVSESVISRDLSILRQQARDNIRYHLQDRLPLELEKSIVALNSVRKEAWQVAEESGGNSRLKLQALALVTDTSLKILDLLTNGGIIDGAIEMVENGHGKSLVHGPGNEMTHKS
jgi:transcription elongation factor